MKEINISHFPNKRIKTLIHFYNYIFANEIQPNIIDAEEFIDKYMPEVKNFIFKSTDGNLKNLDSILFITDNEKRIKEEYEKKKEQLFNKRCQRIDEIINQEEIMLESFKKYSMKSVMSNICTVFIMIDVSLKADESIFENIELGQYEEVHKKLTDKILQLIFINGSVTDYVMDIYRGKEFDFSKHYNTIPDMHRYLIYQRNIQNNKNIDKIVGMNNCFISDVVLGFELLSIKHKTDILKLILILICIYKSYEYEQCIQEYAKLLINLIQEVMFCGEIFKIYIQMKDFKTNIPISERGSDDATTRFSVIFSTSNHDIYLLRIDLPHKGEEKFHLNLHECINGKMLPTGYPLDDNAENNIKLSNLLGNKFDTLFFRNEEHIWFRTNFERKLFVLNLDQENKDELLLLFKHQCHYPIELNISDQNKYLEFLEEMKEYLISMGLESSIIKSFDKSSLNIRKEILKIRICQNYMDELIDEMDRTMNGTVNGNKYIWNLFEILGLNEVIKEEKIMSSSFSECWKYVDEYIFK